MSKLKPDVISKLPEENKLNPVYRICTGCPKSANQWHVFRTLKREVRGYGKALQLRPPEFKLHPKLNCNKAPASSWQ